ncbi:MAG: helix-turn-helix domain-containing protein [Defluviitaleaceae bacterium]|nr:helix-turn-helix domain-containing protein [Defluviitaleaceae bacterium]
MDWLEEFNNGVPNIEYFFYRNNTPDWKIEPSTTNFIDITYILGGSADYIINGKKVSVTKGNLLCIPENSAREATSHSAGLFECFAINFRMDNDNTENAEKVRLGLPLISNIGIQSDIISHYKRLNEDWLRRPPGYIMKTKAHFMLILQRFLEMLIYEVDSFNFDHRIKTAIRHITENYSEDVTIQQVAEMVQLNPTYFGALFKKETRMTFKNYLNMIRLNQAEDMLRMGKSNVSEVAIKCGFKDMFYFSRLYKQHKGIPPSAIKP